VSLEADPSTFSGFRWVSGKGPQVAIGSGTPCQGEIILEEVPPASYVMPFFRKVLLGESEEFRSSPH
jgi:HlyD family secretion protein